MFERNGACLAWPFALFFFWFFLMFASLQHQWVRNAGAKLDSTKTVEEWVGLLMAGVLLIDLKPHQMLEDKSTNAIPPRAYRALSPC